VYLPPEVLREERVSLKLDVYSFGMILWELIARDLPFQVQAGFCACTRLVLSLTVYLHVCLSARPF